MRAHDDYAARCTVADGLFTPDIINHTHPLCRVVRDDPNCPRRQYLLSAAARLFLRHAFAMLLPRVPLYTNTATRTREYVVYALFAATPPFSFFTRLILMRCPLFAFFA